MAQPRGGPSGGAVCSLLPRPPPSECLPGGTPGRRATRPQTAGSDGRGSSFARRPVRAPASAPAAAGPRAAPGDVADAWGASGAPSWRGAQGELTRGSPTLSLQLPSCSSLVTLPSPCRGVGGRRASQASTGWARAARSPASRLVNVPASWCGPVTCSPTWERLRRARIPGEATGRWKIRDKIRLGSKQHLCVWVDESALSTRSPRPPCLRVHRVPFQREGAERAQ